MINRKNSLARRYSGALLLLTVASLLIACGGAESASSSSTTATASNTATLTWGCPTISRYQRLPRLLRHHPGTGAPDILETPRRP